MAIKYWYSTTSANFATTNWYTSPPTGSGAPGTATTFATGDDAVFNAFSGAVTVTVAATVSARSITITGWTGTLAGTSAIGITGGDTSNNALVLDTTFTPSYNGTITFTGTGSYNILTKNVGLNCNVIFNAAGTWTLPSTAGGGALVLNFATAISLQVLSGTLICNGTVTNARGTFNLSAGIIASTGAVARTIRATDIEIAGTSATAWNTSGTNLNLRNSGNTGAPNLWLTNSTAATRYIVNTATTIAANLNLNNVYITGNPNGAAIGINGWATGTIANVYVNIPAGATTGTVTYNGCTITGSLDFTGLTTATAVASNATTTLNGNLILSPTYTITGTAPIIFGGTSTVTGNSKTYPGAVTINTTGSVTFSDTITLGSTLTLTAATGGVTTNGVFNVTGATTHTASTLTLNSVASFAAYTMNGGTLVTSSIINTSGLVNITGGSFGIRDINFNSLTVGTSGTLTSSSTATSISITTTSGSNSVTLNGFSTSFLVAGATITGTGFATPVTIVSITNSTTFVVSANANASGTNTVSYSAYTYIAGTYTHTGTATFNKNVYCNVLTLTGGTLTCNENFNFAASSSVATGTITNTTVTPKTLASNSISTSTGTITGTTATLTLTSGSIIFPYITVGFFNASNATAKTLTTNTVNLTGSNATAANAYVWNTTAATIGTNFTCTVGSIYLTATPGSSADYSIFYPGANCPLPNTDIYLQGSGQKGLYACTVRNVYPSGTITIVGLTSATINNDFYCDGNATITFNTTIPWTVGGNFLLPGGNGGGSGSATFTTSPVLTLTNANNNSVITIGGSLSNNYTSAITLNDANSKVFNFIDPFSSSSTLTLTSGKVRANYNLTFTTINLTSGSTDAILLGSGSTGWTTGTGWSGNSTSGFVHTPGNTATLTNSILPSLGAVYAINYTITGATTGSVSISFAGNTTTGLNSSFFKCIVSSSNTANLIITPTSDFNGTILVTIREVSFAGKGDLTGTATTFNNDSIYISGSLYCTTLTANNARLYIDTGNLNLAGTTSLNLSYGGYIYNGINNSTNTGVTITSSASATYNIPNGGITYGVSTSGTTLTVSGNANLNVSGIISPYTFTVSGGAANVTILSGGQISPSVTTGNGLIIGGATFTMNRGSIYSVAGTNGLSISSGTNVFNADSAYLMSFKTLTITGGTTTFRKYVQITVYGNISVTGGTLNVGYIDNTAYGSFTIGSAGIVNSYLDGTSIGAGVISNIIANGSGSWKARITVASTSEVEVGQQVAVTYNIGGTGSLYTGATPTYCEVTAVIDCYNFEYTITGASGPPVAGTLTDLRTGANGSYGGLLTNSLTATVDAILSVDRRLYMHTGALTFTGTSLTVKKYLEYNTTSTLTINVISACDIYYGINASGTGQISFLSINTNSTGTYQGGISIGSTSIPLSQMYTTYSAGGITLGWGTLNINVNLSITAWNSDTTSYNSTTAKYLNIRKGVTLTVRNANAAANSFSYIQYAFNANNPNQNISGGAGLGIGLTYISFKGAVIKFTNGTLNNVATTSVHYMDSVGNTGPNGGTIWFNRQTDNPSYNGTTNTYTANGTNTIFCPGGGLGDIYFDAIWDGEPDWNNKQGYNIVNHTVIIVTGSFYMYVSDFSVNGYQSVLGGVTYNTTITVSGSYNLANYSVGHQLYKSNITQSSGVYETYTTGVLEVGSYYKINTIVSCDNFTNVGYVSPGVPFIATGTTPTNWTYGTSVIKLNTLIVGKTYRIDTLVAGDNFLNVGFVAVGLPFIATAAVPTNWTTTVIYQLGTEVNVNNLNIINSIVRPGIDSSGATTDTWHAYNSTDNNNGTVTCLGWDFVLFRYWVGATTANWNSTLGWSSTSGGSTGFSVPTAKTNVIFDANSNYCNLNVAGVCKNFQSLNWGYGWSTTTTNGLTINGNAEIGDAFMYNITISTITVNSDNKISTLKFGNSIANGSLPLSNNLVLTAPNGGEILLTSNLVQASGKTIEHRLGIFDTGGYNITTTRFFNNQSTGSPYANIYLRSSNIIITQSANLSFGWEIANNYCSVDGGTSTIRMNDTSNNTIYFRACGTAYVYYNTYNNIIWDRGASTGGISMYGNTTINNFTDYGSAAHTLRFEQNSSGTVQFNFSAFNVNGSLGNIITLTTTATPYIPVFVFNGTGVVICNYVAVSYNDANPNANVWYTNPVNLGTSVTGWNTGIVPTNYKRAMLLGVGGAN